MEQTKAITFTS